MGGGLLDGYDKQGGLLRLLKADLVCCFASSARSIRNAGGIAKVGMTIGFYGLWVGDKRTIKWVVAINARVTIPSWAVGTRW